MLLRLLVIAFLLLLLLLSLLLVCFLFALPLQLVLLAERPPVAGFAQGHLLIDGCHKRSHFAAHFQGFLFPSCGGVVLCGYFFRLNFLEVIEVFVDFFQVFIVACLSKLH